MSKHNKNKKHPARHQQKPTNDPTPISRPPTGTIPKSMPSKTNNDKPETQRRWTNDPPMFWVTLAGVIAVVAYTSVALWQACLANSQLGEMKVASGLMQSQLDITKQALVDVERPVIVVSVPEDFRIDPSIPNISIRIENVGRQIAIVNVATGSLVVQNETDPGPVQIAFRNDGTACRTFTVGQWILKPNEPKIITCDRQTAFTTTEVDGMNKKTLIGLLRLNLLYDDTVGYRHFSGWIFLAAPQGNNVSKFIQLSKTETRSKELTAEQDEQNRRALIDTLLQIDRPRSSSPTPAQ